MIRALELSAKATGNRVLEKRVSAAAARVVEGARLSGRARGPSAYSPSAHRHGREERNARRDARKGRGRLRRGFRAKDPEGPRGAEPGMILVMGVAVGFIVLAVLCRCSR